MSWFHDTPTQREIEIARHAGMPLPELDAPFDDEGNGLVALVLMAAGALGFWTGLLVGWWLA